MRRRELLALVGAAAALRATPAYAEQQALPVIGWLSTFPATGPEALRELASFRQGLAEVGFIDGQNVRLEYRWAELRPDRLPALAAELVARRVDVIVTQGGDIPAAAAKNATSSIPIVFHTGADPVAAGLIASLARPGGNLTGISMMAPELTPKLLELLLELVPRARAVALLQNPASPYAKQVVTLVQEAARAKAVHLDVLNATAAADFDTAFAGLAHLQVQGLIVHIPFDRHLVARLASRQQVPAIALWRDFPAAGGLISYGPSLVDVYRQKGVYAGRIIKGAKPADLPVEQPTKFELVINLKTAKALGLAVPQSLLARADEVIEEP